MLRRPLLLVFATTLSFLGCPRRAPGVDGGMREDAGLGDAGTDARDARDAVDADRPIEGIFVEPDLSGDLEALDAVPTLEPMLEISHPLAGALLPPTLPLLEVTFAPAAASSVYALVAAGGDTRTEMRFGCGDPADASRWCTCSSVQCVLRVSGEPWDRIVEGARGASLAISLRRATGSALVEGPSVRVDVASADVPGGLYFWQLEPSRLLRYELTRSGVARGTDRAEPYLTPTRAGRECIGCHAIDESGERMLFAGGPPEDAIRVIDVATRARIAGISLSSGYVSAAFDGSGTRVAAFENDRSTSGTGVLRIADVGMGGPGVITPSVTVTGLRTGFGPNASVDLTWSPVRDELAYASIGQSGGEILRSYITTLTREGTSWTSRDLVDREARERISGSTQVTNPTFVPGGEWVTFYDRPVTAVLGTYRMIPRLGGALVPLVSPSPVADGASFRLTNETSLLRFYPDVLSEGRAPIVWGVVSTNRRLGAEDVGLQLWIFALRMDRAALGIDPSTVPVHLPFQSAGVRYLLAQWSRTVSRAACTAPSDCDAGELCEAGACVPEVF